MIAKTLLTNLGKGETYWGNVKLAKD